MDDYATKWLIKAEADVKLIENELSLPVERIVTEAVCFHAQQAVEKFLKAFLVTCGVEFGKTHNLEYLLELCKKIDINFSQLSVGKLTSYAIEVRYPDEFYTPTIEEAKESAGIVIKIRDFIHSKII